MLTCFRCLSAATARSLRECGRPTNSRLLSRALPRSCSRMPFSPWCKERSGQGPPPPQRPAPGKQPHHLVRRGVCTCLAPSLSIRRANWQGHQSKWEKPFSPASVGWGRWRESRSLSGEQVRQQGSQVGAPTLGHPPSPSPLRKGQMAGAQSRHVRPTLHPVNVYCRNGSGRRRQGLAPPQGAPVPRLPTIPHSPMHMWTGRQNIFQSRGSSHHI